MKNRTRLIILSCFLLVLMTGILLLFLYLPTQASGEATFIVNTVSDTDDGTCDGAHCSLREAINAANGAGGADSIEFSLLPGATITLAGSQLPIITDTVTINGNTAVSLTISGDNLTRTFYIGIGTAVTLTNLAIRHGRALTGGAIYNDGGILTVENSLVAENLAEYGGGIYNDAGTLTISNSRIVNNFAEYGGGGIVTTENTTTTIHSTVFGDNLADAEVNFETIRGGAILNAGNMTIQDSTFSNNKALADANPVLPSPIKGFSRGGAIYNSGILAVGNSTFNNNLVTASSEPFLSNMLSKLVLNDSAIGAGIYNLGLMTISNSTFSANKAIAAESHHNAVQGDAFAAGGGVFNNGTLVLINSTFSENGTERYPWGAGEGGSLFNNNVLYLSNTLIANSDDNVDCVNLGTIATNVNNLVEDGSCNSILSGDPLLYPLQDNGGPTWTHALSSISIAIDKGDNGTCMASPVNNLDQRGVIRPQDGDGDGAAFCDIGAFEYDGPPPYRSFLPVIRRD